MDSQTLQLIQDLILKLQAGPFDEATLMWIVGEIKHKIPQLLAKGQRQTLVDIVDLLEGWSESAQGGKLASQALLLAGTIAELDLHDPDRAASYYSLSLHLFPANLEAMNQLVALCLNQGQFQRLESLLVKQVRSLSEAKTCDASIRAQVLHTLGRLRFGHLKNLDLAIEAYESALDADPDITRITELAGIYALRGREGDAQRAADFYFTVGELLGNPQGIESLNRALDQVPTHLEALMMLESFYDENQRPAQLMHRWETFIMQAPSDQKSDSLRLIMCQAYMAKERYEDAYRCIKPLVDKGDAAAGYLFEEIRQTLPDDIKQIDQLQASAPSKIGTDTPVYRGKKEEEQSTLNPTVANSFQASESQLAFASPERRLESSDDIRAASRPLDPSVYSDAPQSLLPGEITVKAAKRFSSLLSFPRLNSKMSLMMGIGLILLVAVSSFVFGRISAPGETTLASSSTDQLSTALEHTEPNVIQAPGVEPPSVPATTPSPTESKAQSATTPSPTESKAQSATTPSPTEVTTDEAKDDGTVTLVPRAAKYKGGKIDREESIQALRSSLPDMDGCYEQAIERNPRLEGWMVFTWTVKPDGGVAAAKNIRGSIKDERLIRCMSSVISEVRFPKPKRGRARILFPFEFEPKG